MTDTETIHPSAAPAPIVDIAAMREIADGVWVIPDDHRVPLVPNIGIIVGKESVLVVDTGMGPENGKLVLDAAKKLAGKRRLFLTLSHYHPEHGYGASVFRDEATIFYNAAQRDEFLAKRAGYLDLFRTFGPTVVDALENTEFVPPHIVYQGPGAEIDLGDKIVRLHTWGMAHTAGDQIIFVPDSGVMFMGDLAEERFFPIFPWFPPDDTDIDAKNWIAVLKDCEAMRPTLVVPGHGAVGDVGIIKGVRSYLERLGSAVKSHRTKTHDVDVIVRELAPAIRAEYPDWDAAEWIEFGIRYFHAADA
jgi:glyoxylase-like metal-dependent hydrolase (beta-lactamase superfamily II)